MIVKRNSLGTIRRTISAFT